MTRLPPDSEIVAFIWDLLAEDVRKHDGVKTTHTIRSVRTALADHFDVLADDLKESKRHLIKETVEKAIDDLLQDDEEDGGDTDEEEEKPPLRDPARAEKTSGDRADADPSPALDSGMSSLDDSDVGEGSSDGTTKKARRKSKQGSTSKGDSKSKRKERKKPAGSADKMEEEIARLKKLVVACGVRKQWSSWFKKESANTTKDQAKALRSLLSELGMDGRLSMEKAKKIKEHREFQEELEAIGADTGANAKENKNRASRSELQRNKREVEEGSEESSKEDSEEDVKPVAKKSRLGASLAAFAAELNSDDE